MTEASEPPDHQFVHRHELLRVTEVEEEHVRVLGLGHGLQQPIADGVLVKSRQRLASAGDPVNEHEADGEHERGSEAGPGDEGQVGPRLGAGGRRPARVAGDVDWLVPERRAADLGLSVKRAVRTRVAVRMVD